MQLLSYFRNNFETLHSSGTNSSTLSVLLLYCFLPWLVSV